MNILEQETRIFWNVIHQARAAKREGRLTPEAVRQNRDELEAIAMYTESACLRRKCQAAVHRCDAFLAAAA